MTAKRFILTALAAGYLAFGAASAWAAEEFNAIKVYDLFKFSEMEADDWSQSGKGNQIEYECIDDTDGCKVVVLGVGVGGGVVINIEYTCLVGNKVLLHPSGLLIIPNTCDGAVA